MYTLISGSPKVRSSNSLHFLKIISSNIDEYNFFELKDTKYEGIINSILKSDTIVLAFPLYVDSPPSLVLSLLDYIIDKKLDLVGKLVYVIINCGFREGEHNKTAVNIIKRWCEKVGAIYGCSIQIGAGEIVGKEKYKFISRKALKNLNHFTNIVRYRKISPDIITTMDLINNTLYCSMANISWNRKAKKSNLSKYDLRSK